MTATISKRNKMTVIDNQVIWLQILKSDSSVYEVFTTRSSAEDFNRERPGAYFYPKRAMATLRISNS